MLHLCQAFVCRDKFYFEIAGMCGFGPANSMHTSSGRPPLVLGRAGFIRLPAAGSPCRLCFPRALMSASEPGLTLLDQTLAAPAVAPRR